MKLKTLLQKAIELEEEYGDCEVEVMLPDGAAARLAVEDLGVFVGQGETVVIETGR